MEVPHKFTVLYVDDDEDSCVMLQTLLAFSDVDVSPEHTVKAAFHSAELKHFDMFLLANRFDIGNGVDLCRDLHKFSPKTPIVFYTGDARAADRQKAMDAGEMPPPSPFRDALREDGWKWVLAEVALLVVLGLLSMGLDRWQAERKKRRLSEPEA